MELLKMALASGLTVAIWKTVEQVVLWKLNRRASKEDTTEDKTKQDAAETKRRLSDVESKLDMLTNASKINMYDRIKYLCRNNIKSGSISYEDREDIVHMHEAYHALGGNGHLDVVMAEVKALPLKEAKAN